MRKDLLTEIETLAPGFGGGQRALEFPKSQAAERLENLSVRIQMTEPRAVDTGVPVIKKREGKTDKEVITRGTGFLFPGGEISKRTDQDLQRLARIKQETSKQFEFTNFNTQEAHKLETTITDAEATLRLDALEFEKDVFIKMPEMDGPLAQMFRFDAEPAQFQIKKAAPTKPNAADEKFAEKIGLNPSDVATKEPRPVIDTVEIKFASRIDRIIYEVKGPMTNALVKARRKASQLYLMQAFGISRRAAIRMRKNLFTDIESGLLR